MPYGRYPERVKAFRKWAQQQTDDAKLSGSATPGRKRSRGSRRPRRRSRRKKTQE